MTNTEFATVAAYITAGTGHALKAESMRVYFDCLQDLPFEAVMIGAKRVMMSHRWPSFPSIAEIRELATATAQGTVVAITSAEAWELAWNAVGMIDPEVEYRQLSSVAAKLKLPALVVRAMEVYGVHALCYGKEPLTVIRGQFMKTYEQLAGREQRTALLPAAVKDAIEGIGRVPQLTGGIGMEAASE